MCVSMALATRRRTKQGSFVNGAKYFMASLTRQKRGRRTPAVVGEERRIHWSIAIEHYKSQYSIPTVRARIVAWRYRIYPRVIRLSFNLDACDVNACEVDGRWFV